MLTALNSSGPVHTVLKVTGTSTAGPNSMCTMQMRLTTDPMGRTGLEVADLHVTEVGAETEDSSVIF